MKDLEFLKLFGDIDCDMVCECLPARAGKKPQKTVRTVPRFLSRAASVAAAAVLALFISTATAEAAGVRVVTPFVSWTGSTLRLDYSAGLDKHEDAPEITAPDVIVTEEGTDGERFVTESESELHLLAGNKLRFPGNEAGLEFVSAKGIIDDEDISIVSDYMRNGSAVRIRSRYVSETIGTEYSAYSAGFMNVSRYETKYINDIECTCIYGTKNCISIVLPNEIYLIMGDVQMSELETIAASILPIS